MRAPCEERYRKILPFVRRELARVLVTEYHLSQKKVAEILGVTEAAVSQYLKGKRGKYEDYRVEKTIRKVAKKIIEGEDSLPFCILCREITLQTQE
jgi:predicted transcriptional regulator